MAIEGLIGRPGAGKTYELTRRALREADRDRMVFSNYPIVHPNVWLFTPDQLMDLPPGLVVIDEAHLWFPARMALKLPMSWLAGMSQTRKNGWDLIWAAQHENRVDRVVRDVTSWMHLSSAWFGGEGKPPVVFATTCWEPETFRRPKKQRSRSWSLFSQRVASSYDTHGRIEQAKHTKAAEDAYASDKPARAPRRGGSVLEGNV